MCMPGAVITCHVLLLLKRQQQQQLVLEFHRTGSYMDLIMTEIVL